MSCYPLRPMDDDSKVPAAAGSPLALGLAELAAAIRRREWRATEVLDHALRRIAAT